MSLFQQRSFTQLEEYEHISIAEQGACYPDGENERKKKIDDVAGKDVRQ